MKHQATASFWKRYDKLDPQVRLLADKNFALLKHDPKHPSLYFKCIENDLWSVRVGMHYRALALREEDVFSWIWIGPHSEYDRLV